MKHINNYFRDIQQSNSSGVARRLRRTPGAARPTTLSSTSRREPARSKMSCDAYTKSQ